MEGGQRPLHICLRRQRLPPRDIRVLQLFREAGVLGLQLALLLCEAVLLELQLLVVVLDKYLALSLGLSVDVSLVLLLPLLQLGVRLGEELLVGSLGGHHLLVHHRQVLTLCFLLRRRAGPRRTR